jgi:hypothetical protein
MNTVCIKSVDVIFLDENNNIIESTVPSYSSEFIERFEGDDIVRYYEFELCESKKFNPKMLVEYGKKVKQDMYIPNHNAWLNNKSHHTKIKIRKILKKVPIVNNNDTTVSGHEYNTFSVESATGVITLDKPPRIIGSTVTIGNDTYKGIIRIGGPIDVGTSINIFEKTHFSYVVNFDSFKLFDINNNFIRNINGSDIIKRHYPRNYGYVSEKIMCMDANDNYLSYNIPDDLDSCIVEFDIFI